MAYTEHEFGSAEELADRRRALEVLLAQLEPATTEPEPEPKARRLTVAPRSGVAMRTPAEATFTVALVLYVLAAGLGVAAAAVTFGLGAALLAGAITVLFPALWFLRESVLHARVGVSMPAEDVV